jgi:hypothetical protein
MAYPTLLPVLVIHEMDALTGKTPNPHRDWVGGLNAGHALSRARKEYPKAQILDAETLRWREITLSNCRCGCKVMEEKATGYREIYHSSVYGCALGKDKFFRYESDLDRTHTPGGDCDLCGSPALIRRGRGGWICSSTCA